MSFIEPDVALTDYALTVECLAFGLLVSAVKTTSKESQFWIVAAFFGLSAASLTGGTVHGFFSTESSMAYKFLWPMALLSIGVTSLASWNFSVGVLLHARAKRLTKMFAFIAFCAYAIEVSFFDQHFKMAICFYFPSAILLLCASAFIYFHDRTFPAAAGLFGILLTLIAPVFQQRGVCWPALHLNHNAVYHLFQGTANAMVFWAAQWFLKRKPAL